MSDDNEACTIIWRKSEMRDIEKHQTSSTKLQINPKAQCGDHLDWSLMLHGEQVIRLSQPLAPEGKTIQVGEVLNINERLSSLKD